MWDIGTDWKEAQRNLLGMTEIFQILIWMVASWVYTSVKTHQTTHLKSGHFITGKLYLNNTDRTCTCIRHEAASGLWPHLFHSLQHRLTLLLTPCLPYLCWEETFHGILMTAPRSLTEFSRFHLMQSKTLQSNKAHWNNHGKYAYSNT